MSEAKIIGLAGVPARVKELAGINITRQTVYNWASKGRKSHRLCEPVRLRTIYGSWRDYIAKPAEGGEG